MFDHLRQRVGAVLAETREVTLATTGPAGLQAGTLPCQALQLRLYVLVPRTSEHLVNVGGGAQALVTTPGWQARCRAAVLPTVALPEGLALPQHPDAEWCAILELVPERLEMVRADGWGSLETIDLE